MLRGDFNLEGFFGREPQLPRHLTRRAVQVFFLAVHRVRELDQHALRQTAVQVELQHIAPRGAHHHTRTKNTQVVVAHARDATHFLGQIGFDACRTGQEEMKLIQ